MPPRKRTTRINARAKPKAPEGDEGKSLTEQERRLKLDVFLQDYDATVKHHLKEMDDKINRLCKSVTMKLQSEILSLPQDVRNMTMKEFIECGGTKQSAMEYLEMKRRDETRVIGSSCTASSRLVNTISQVRPNLLCDTIIEEQSASPTPMQNRSRQRGVGGTVRKGHHAGHPDSVYRPSAVLSSTFKSRYRTPAHQNLASTGWETPLITPKFNPNLPYTPAGAREARPGERLLSITGSPIANPADPNIKLKGAGLSFHIENINDLDNISIDIPESHMEKVLSVLSSVMQKAKQ